MYFLSDVHNNSYQVAENNKDKYNIKTLMLIEIWTAI